jgi:signal transduction histidine kinase
MNKENGYGKSDLVSTGGHEDSSFARQIAMSGPGLMAVVDGRDTRFLFANSIFIRHIGYSLERLEQMKFTDLLAPAYQERFYSHLAEVSESTSAYSSFVIYYVSDFNGKVNTLYLYASPMVSQQGTGRNGMFKLFMLPDRSGWGMPFTSFETRELFLELFETENFGTYEWIIGTDRVFWSGGVYRIYEVDPTFMEINLNYSNRFIHPADEKRVKEEYQKTLDTHCDFKIEYRIITAKKNIKTVQSLARVIKDADGNPLKFTGSLRDVTPQRAIENDLKNKVEELHRSNRELEEFAYAASHDMLEPLRKITTFSERLGEKYKQELIGEGAMYLSRVVASAENMRQLINGLLEFSKIAQTAAPFVRVDLNNIIMEVINDWELKIEETGTAIRCTGLPIVAAVSSQLKQLFMNLIGNAIKFRKPGVPPIIRIDVVPATEEEVLLHQLQPSKEYHKISVSDNGIGFEDEYANRIFQVFQRLHGKSEYPGSGIGLSICKKILEYHNGAIYAENVADVGARFVFFLPATQ